jgi:hypothetical protein
MQQPVHVCLHILSQHNFQLTGRCCAPLLLQLMQALSGGVAVHACTLLAQH